MKIFWSVFIGILLLLFSTVFFGWNYVPSWISKSLSEKAKVKVTLNHISLGLRKIKGFNLKVNNPPRSILPKALKIKKIVSNAPLTTYFHDDVIIDDLLLSDTYLGLEFDSTFGSDGNWTTIMNNLRRSLGQDSKKDSNRKVLIRRLEIKNLNIDLVFKTNSENIRRLKPIESMVFYNVTSEGGLPTGQIMNLVISEMLKEVFSKEKLMDMLKDTIQSPGRSGQDVFDSLKSLF